MENDNEKLEFQEQTPPLKQEKLQKTESSKTSLWVINHSLGVIKTEKQATSALVVFIVLSFIISLFLIFGEENQNKQTYTPAADAPIEDLTPNRQ